MTHERIIVLDTGFDTHRTLRHAYGKTAAPTVNDDATLVSGKAYGVGSLWFDTTNDRAYLCLDATIGAAVWKEVAVIGSIDHGGLLGLGDDDHPQYATDADLTAHAGAADPHTGYRLESADHSHQSTGLQAGQIDHGLALVGLGDDDHAQYLKEKASGGTAAETPEHTHASAAQAGTVSHADLTGVTSGQHHAQAHAIDGADHTGVLADAQIPATIARDTEVTTAVSDHAAAADPHTGYQKESEKGAASGYASLDAGTKVPTAQLGSGVADATTFLRGDQSYAVPPGGGSGAPTGADYLVGTAHPDLSAEIVVGTTPGGELGGTWAAPTVDATHSGSAHHAQAHDHSAAGDGTALAPVTAAVSQYLRLNSQDEFIFTGDVTDFDISTRSVWRLAPNGANRIVRGFNNGSAGRVLVLVNVDSTFVIDFTEEDAAAVAANRVAASDVTSEIRPGGGLVLVYDADASRWRVVANTSLNYGEVGDMAAAWAFGGANSVGVDDEVSRADHQHAAPANPVTAHEAAGDPHTGYRLESADHSHASSGLQGGTIDHGALTGMGDDDHTQYLLESVISGLATPAIVLGTAAAAGSGTTPIRHNSTIAAFDATNPVTHEVGDGTAGTGAAAFAARRDHDHASKTRKTVLRKSANQTITTATNTLLTFGAGDVLSDADSMFSDASDAIVVDRTGLWLLYASADWDTNTTGLRRQWIRSNAVDIMMDQKSPTAASTITQCGGLAWLTSGDVIDTRVRQDSGANRVVNPSRLMAVFLGG